MTKSRPLRKSTTHPTQFCSSDPAEPSSGTAHHKQGSCTGNSDSRGQQPTAPGRDTQPARYPALWPHRQHRDTSLLSVFFFFLRNEKWIHLHGSLAMNWGTVLGRGALGFGVPTSLFLAIFVFALANSSRSVCGISGSKRMPFGNKRTNGRCFHFLRVKPEWRQRKHSRKSWPVCKRKKVSTRSHAHGAHQIRGHPRPACPGSQGGFVYFSFSYAGFQLFFMDKNFQVLNVDQQIMSIVTNFN